MTTSTIAHRIDEFNTGFEAAIGADLYRVFTDEQRALLDAGVPANAVTVGSPLPEARLIDASGTQIDLATVVAGAPAVLVFYRGAWCPYCNVALKTYQAELAPILRDAGVALVAISPQTPDGSATAVQEWELDFTVLSDPANALSRDLGIFTEPSGEAREAHTALGFDVADSNADGTAGIPFPTVLVIDAQGVVRFADVHVDYTSRTESADILAAVRAL